MDGLNGQKESYRLAKNQADEIYRSIVNPNEVSSIIKLIEILSEMQHKYFDKTLAIDIPDEAKRNLPNVVQIYNNLTVNC